MERTLVLYVTYGYNTATRKTDTPLKPSTAGN